MQIHSSLQTLLQEINWLEKVINTSIGTYLNQEEIEFDNWQEIPLPDLSETDDVYASFVKEKELDLYDRLTLALAFTPHLQPEVLDVFFGQNSVYGRSFTEFGGRTDKEYCGFLPTGQTLLFIATSSDPELRLEITNRFDPNYFFKKEQILELSETPSYIPKFNGILTISERWLYYFLTGIMPQVEQSAVFPAKKIDTQLSWEDLVLNDVVMEQVYELSSWLQHGKTLLQDWKLYKKIKPGYRALFYGPPGTGKTLTVTLLGKASGREVYRVDLSMIVSKYIGETEKNLSKIFDIAAHKDWILFFDEADALFGKRTQANSSNDRHANQQTAYLLQRIEDFPGVVILASNLKSNMDEAFTRRFQLMIHFTKPTTEERYELWKNAFSGTCTLDEEIDLWKVAKTYELAGGNIINVLRYCALAAIRRGDTVVNQYELMEGIRKEFKKEGRSTFTIYD
jgi:AAA+ superfamily predicted ATPase